MAKCVCDDAPEVNRRVIIQQLSSPSEDAHGEIKRSTDANWAAVATKWAGFKSKGGAERFASDQVQAGRFCEVWFRYDTTTVTITPNMRLKYGTRILNILNAEDVDEKHEWILCDCSEDR